MRGRRSAGTRRAGAPGVAVAGLVPVELGRIGVGVAQQEGASPSGYSVAVGCSVFRYSSPCRPGRHPAARGRAAHPERVPGAEDVVVEPRLRDLRGLDRAAEPVVPLEHADAPAGLREQRRAGEPVDAAADDDGVVPAGSAVIDQPPELVVGHQPVLLHAQLLHRAPARPPTLVGEVEAELVRLDAHRVEPALLAEHDRPVRSQRAPTSRARSTAGRGTGWRPRGSRGGRASRR